MMLVVMAPRVLWVSYRCNWPLFSTTTRWDGTWALRLWSFFVRVWRQQKQQRRQKRLPQVFNSLVDQSSIEKICLFRSKEEAEPKCLIGTSGRYQVRCTRSLGCRLVCEYIPYEVEQATRSFLCVWEGDKVSFVAHRCYALDIACCTPRSVGAGSAMVH